MTSSLEAKLIADVAIALRYVANGGNPRNLDMGNYISICNTLLYRAGRPDLVDEARVRAEQLKEGEGR